MRFTRSADHAHASVRVEAAPSVDLLPADAARLWSAEIAGFQSTPAWFRASIEAALPPGAAPCFVLCREQQRPVALFPLLQLSNGDVQSLTTPYTCLYEPWLARETNAETLRRVGQAFGRYCRAWPTVKLEALDPDWPGLTPLLAGIRDAGLHAQLFQHFGNWHQPVAGMSWQEYLETRPGSLRTTIQRKLRANQRDGRMRLEIRRSEDGLGPAIAAYEDVYRRSWKQPEPYPHFNAALMRHAAQAGVLRLGLLYLGETPVAGQYWIVASGAATVLKLAHDEAFKPLSPGTVLTAHMVRDLIERDRVNELDFGRGDDPYKQLWTGQRRSRIGVLLANPRRIGGLVAIGRPLLARARNQLTRRKPGAERP